MFPASGLGACVRDSSIEVHPGVGQSRALSAFWSFECIMAAEFLSWLSRGCACPFLHLPCGSSLPAPVCCLFAVLAPHLLGYCLYDGFVRALCSGSNVFSRMASWDFYSACVVNPGPVSFTILPGGVFILRTSQLHSLLVACALYVSLKGVLPFSGPQTSVRCIFECAASFSLAASCCPL